VQPLIALNRLPPAEAQAVLDKVLALDTQIFAHRDDALQERFYAAVRDLSVGEKLVVLYGDAADPVGFNLIKLLPIALRGRTVWVVGSIAGFLPGHIGENRTMVDAIRAMILHKLRHPDREMYFVSFLINPGGYGMLVDLCPTTFPSVGRPTPIGIEQELILATAGASGVELLRDEPGRTLGTVGRSPRQAYQRGRDSDHVRFFEARNPGYAKGDLLGVCVPLGFADLLEGGYRLLVRRLRKRARRRVG
jgi:hypothetical protein